MIVPVLTLWLGAPFRRAVATSLVIIALTGIAALASHLLDGRAAGRRSSTAMLACSTGVGALLGTLVADRLPTVLLGRGFAVIVARSRLRARRRCCCPTCSSLGGRAGRCKRSTLAARCRP